MRPPFNHQRAHQFRWAAVAAAALALFLTSAVAADAASPKSVPLAKNALFALKFSSPRSRLVFGNSVRVVVRVPADTKTFRAVAGGKVISGRFVRRGSTTRVARIPVGKILRRGVNHVNVFVRTRSGGSGAGDLRFIVAAKGRRAASAAVVPQATGFLAQLRLADSADHFRAVLNGHDISTRFSRLTTGRQSVPVSPDEGLRFGANRLQITAALANGRYLRKTVRFRVSGKRPLAAAGRDRTARAGDRVTLSAGRTRSKSGSAKLRWRVKSAPKGSTPKLSNSHGRRPALVTDRPGRYEIELTATAGGRRGSDVATVLTTPNTAPIGASVKTFAPQTGGGYAIEVADNCIGGNASCGKIVSPYTSSQPVQLLLLNRDTLSVYRTLHFSGSAGDAAIALGILNAVAGTGGQVDYIGILGAPPGSNVDPGWKLAISELTGTTPEISANGGWSAIGVPNQNFNSTGNVTGQFNDDSVPSMGPTEGELGGFFSFDPVEQIFTFNPSQTVAYQTSAAGSTSAQNVINVGASNYASAPLSAGCVGGIQLVTLRSETLTAPSSLPQNQTFDSNCTNVGLAEIGMLNLDSALQAVASESTSGGDGPLLVFMQTIGAGFQPSPGATYLFASGAIALQIEALGGTGDTFMAAANQTAKGYALAGGNALQSEAPQLSRSLAFGAEASDLAPGTTATLSGPLRLNRFSHFLPTSGSPTTSRIGRLSEIAYQAPTPWPYSSTTSQKNALKYISRHYDIQYSPSSSCYKPTVPDVRFEYCDLNAPWANLLQNLPSHPWSASDCGCTEADWKALRKEIPKEVDSVQRVYKYVALVQKIYGTGSGSTAILGVKSIATSVNNVVNPPAGSGASGWWSDLIANIANGLAVLAPEDSALETVGDAVSAVGYLADDALTTPNGAGTLGQIVSTEASDLPQQVASRYRAASLNFSHFGDMVVTDYGKLSAVAASDEIQLDGDSLDESAGDMMVGAYRFAYRQMLSSAYSALSLPPNNFSTDATTPNTYGCFQNPSDPKTVQYPFSNAAAGAWTSMQRNGPSLPLFGNVTPWMLVLGKKGDLNIVDGIPTPPQSVVGNLTPAITFNSNGVPQTLGEYAPWMMRKSFAQVPLPCPN